MSSHNSFDEKPNETTPFNLFAGGMLCYICHPSVSFDGDHNNYCYVLPIINGCIDERTKSQLNKINDGFLNYKELSTEDIIMLYVGLEKTITDAIKRHLRFDPERHTAVRKYLIKEMKTYFMEKYSKKILQEYNTYFSSDETYTRILEEEYLYYAATFNKFKLNLTNKLKRVGERIREYYDFASLPFSIALTLFQDIMKEINTSKKEKTPSTSY